MRNTDGRRNLPGMRFPGKQASEEAALQESEEIVT